MKIEFMILADAAQAADGKLYILGGGWSLYRSGNYPVQIQMAVGLSILIPWDEANVKHQVTIAVADAAGIPVIPEIKGQVEVAKSPDVPEGTTQKAIIAVNINMMIPRAGTYVVQSTAGTSKTETFFDAIFVGKKVEVVSGSSTERGN